MAINPIFDKSGPIVFFGSGPVAAKSLYFISKHFQIEAIITKAVPEYHKGIAPVEELAKKLGIITYFANSKSEIDELFNHHHFISRLGILVDYGVIVSENIIKSFELGILNSHFSLLPQWRGADPITFSLLSGQQKTGVSLMIIEPTMDTGKIIVQKSLKINKTDTTPLLTDKLIDLSNQLLEQYVPMYLSGNIKPRRQPHPDRATYSRKLTKNDGLIDANKPAHQLECEVRAYSGWPKSYTKFNNKDIIITKAHVSKIADTILDIQCQDSQYLIIDELIAPSGKKMSAINFLNGYNQEK